MIEEIRAYDSQILEKKHFPCTAVWFNLTNSVRITKEPTAFLDISYQLLSFLIVKIPALLQIRQ